MRIERTKKVLIPLALLVFIIWFPVSAQTAVENVLLTWMDTDGFPQIQLTTRILNSARKPVDIIDAGELTITEDGEQVEFDIQKTRVGITTAVVIDINASAKTKQTSEIKNFDLMKDIAKRYAASMGEGDRTAILITRTEAEGGLSLFQDFSGDKGAIGQKLDALNLGDPSSYYSYPMDGVDEALRRLRALEENQPVKSVLLISTGIVSTNPPEIEGRIQTITDIASGSHTPVYTILVNTDLDPRHLDDLAQKNGGMFVHYSGAASLDSMFSEFDSQRLQYQIDYRSDSRSASERVLTISLTGAASPLVIHPFTISPAPQAPLVEPLIVNNNDPVVREAPAWDTDRVNIPLTEVQVRTTFSWPDGFERDLTRAELWVDGQVHGAPMLNPGKELSFPWDLRSYTDTGRKTVRLELKVVGELGFEASSVRQESVVIIVPDRPVEEIIAMPVCDNLSRIPQVGEWLEDNCRIMGITPTQIVNSVLLFIALVFMMLLWFNRGTVAKAGRGVAVRATNLYQRLTQRTGGKLPKARLEAVRGIASGERTVFELFGETPIGRDREHAELVFVNHPHISREHAIIHEDKASGTWTIEDRESANGSFLNGARLDPFKKYPLSDGDTIELAQIERGGIKFKFYLPKRQEEQDGAFFEIAQPASPQKDLQAESPQSFQKDSELDAQPAMDYWQEDDVFQTQQLPRQDLLNGSEGQAPGDDSPNEASPSIDPPDDEFDPSQQTF